VAVQAGNSIEEICSIQEGSRVVLRTVRSIGNVRHEAQAQGRKTAITARNAYLRQNRCV
jgi:hypothetical protein